MDQSNNRTIAKNTLTLYGRSVLMMLIGLYTSRVILQTLGVTDFGIYNAVGGIVAMFGFISGSLGNATSRFITVAIGKGDMDLTVKTFGNVKVIYYLLSVLIVLLGETIGLWFLYHEMSIPADRMQAAFWVYQYSILASVTAFVSVPYNSAIIAHERMSAFAYISLLDAVLKLLVCYLLLVVPYDKLVTYASLLFAREIVDRIIYVVYCSKRFEEVRARPRICREQFRSILAMSGWTISGNLVWILNTQGVNIVLNVFFGPVVNAARGIAMQVQGVMGQFVTNFQTAVNPQITKSYAQGNYVRMGELLQMSSRYSYLLMFTMSLPVCIEAPVILRWWLGTVPDYTVVFLRLVLVSAVVASLSNPLWISVLATGRLKKYMIWDNTIQFLVLPVTYAVFKWMGGSPAWAFAIIAISACIGLYVRVWLVLPLIRYSYREYIQKVISPLICVTLISPILPLLLYGYISSPLINFLLVTLTSLICCGVTIWFLAMYNPERAMIRQKLYNMLAKQHM